VDRPSSFLIDLERGLKAEYLEVLRLEEILEYEVAYHLNY